MPDEVELKLTVAPERADDVRRLELVHRLAEKRGRTHRFSTIYFDTPDQALSERGIALRIRAAGRRRLQTIKLPAEGPDGLQVQQELETPVAGDQPEFDKITDLRVRRLLVDGGIGHTLAPVFVTEFTRTAWPVRVDGSLIELAFDQGEIRAAGRRLPLSEIELELKEGRPEHIFDLALAVHEALPVTLGQATKAARGFALRDGLRPQPVRATPTGLLASMTAREAFAVGARNCLAQVRANEEPARLGEDPEGTHQLRIGLRRFRALVTAYHDSLAPVARDFLSDELRWLQQELNPARDWDVFIATTLEPIFQRMPGLEACLEAAKELRGRAQQRAVATLAAPRYTAFLLRCYSWLATGAWAASEAVALEQPITEFAGAVLQRRHRRLKKFGGKRAELPEAELHRLRLMAKKQRYVSEFLREIYPRRTTARYIAALADIQEVLGSLNDALVSRQLLEELERFLANEPAEGAAGAARAAGMILGWQSRRIAEDLSRFTPVWKQFTHSKIFWPRPNESAATPDLEVR
jgi:inorganic triphosphatase YgiF